MYWGSVRFFKHLFLSILILMIVVPTACAITFGVQNAKLQDSLEVLQEDQAQQQAREAMSNNAFFSTLLVDENLSLPSAFQPNGMPSADFEYQQLYPEMQLPAVGGQTSVSGKVYLTFDDGPSQRTLEVLDVLREKKVKATFFVVGRMLESEEAKEILRQVAAEGHTIGIHTYSHEYRTIYDSVESYLEDFHRVYQQVYEITGQYPEIFRFPGGSINGYNGALYQQLIAEMTRRGFVYYDWNCSAEDATAGKAPKAEMISGKVVESVRNHQRAVVLMHDSNGKESTVKALPQIIDQLQAEGYEFEALSRNVQPVIFGY